jgi:hypothetical protein
MFGVACWMTGDYGGKVVVDHADCTTKGRSKPLEETCIVHHCTTVVIAHPTGRVIFRHIHHRAPPRGWANTKG